jgi:peptide/nickel transport system substrate-binding protein
VTGWRLRAATSLATACTLALVLSATGVSFAARGAARPAAARPVYGGTLNLDTQSQPHTLDPARSEDVVSAQMTYLLFNTLVTYAPTSTRLVPSLATRWQVSDHGRTYTFWLRHGVTFSNGDPFDAADVVYTFTRVNEAATDAPYQSSARTRWSCTWCNRSRTG